MRRCDGIHKGGRPPLSSKPISYYIKLWHDYETMTQTQLATKYAVSRTTITKHLKYAREVIAANE